MENARHKCLIWNSIFYSKSLNSLQNFRRYFDISLQKEVLGRILDSLLDGGALVIGNHESLPSGITCFHLWIRGSKIYRKERGVLE